MLTEKLRTVLEKKRNSYKTSEPACLCKVGGRPNLFFSSFDRNCAGVINIHLILTRVRWRKKSQPRGEQQFALSNSRWQQWVVAFSCQVERRREGARALQVGPRSIDLCRVCQWFGPILFMGHSDLLSLHSVNRKDSIWRSVSSVLRADLKNYFFIF